MGVLTIFTTYKEKNIFMVAVEKGIAGLVSVYKYCYILYGLILYDA